MKKTVLFCLAMAGIAVANAQTDITPANYKFDTSEGIFWDDTYHADVNIVGGSSDVWGAMDADKYWKGGLWVLTSAGQNEGQQAAFRNGWSIVDMGGNVGKVACFAGKASGLKDQLMAQAPDMAENWEAVAVDEEATAGWQLHIWMDPATCPSASEGYIHVKMVYNVYSSTALAGNKLFQNMAISTNQNGLNGVLADGTRPNVWAESQPVLNNVLENGCIKRYEDDGEPELDENEQAIWDPTIWKVLEFDFAIADADDAGLYTPGRLRINAMNGNVWNNYGFLLKELSFTQMEGYPTATNFSYSEISLSPFGPSSVGVESIIDQNENAPVEYYNLQGVKVVNPEKGIYIKKQGNKSSKVVL